MNIKFIYNYKNFEDNTHNKTTYYFNRITKATLNKLILNNNLILKSLTTKEEVYYIFYFNNIKVKIMNLIEVNNILIQLLNLKN